LNILVTYYVKPVVHFSLRYICSYTEWPLQKSNSVLQWKVVYKDHIASLLERLNEGASEYLNAAHERSNTTAEEKAISDAIMKGDNEWK